MNKEPKDAEAAPAAVFHNEDEILQCYKLLNVAGKKKLELYLDYLLTQPKYKNTIRRVK